MTEYRNEKEERELSHTVLSTLYEELQTGNDMPMKDDNRINSFNKIILSTTEGYYPINPEEIIYCKADDSYTHFYMESGQHFVVSRNLKDYEIALCPYNFFSIHKSYMVNINHVSMVRKADGVSVLMSNNVELPIACRKKDAFISFIKSL